MLILIGQEIADVPNTRMRVVIRLLAVADFNGGLCVASV
jgi:hypothetical protein